MPFTASGIYYPASTDAVKPYLHMQQMANSIEPLVAKPLTILILPTNHGVIANTDLTTPFGASSEIYDSHGFHDTVTNNTRITPSIAGWYRFKFTPVWAANVTGQRLHWIVKNGFPLATGYRTNTTLPNDVITLPPVITELSANGTTDYFEAGMRHNVTGVTINLVGNGALGDVYNTMFSCEYIRPL